MSNAFYLNVSYDGEAFTVVDLGRKATGDLFHYLLPIILEKAPIFADEFEGVYYLGILGINRLPAQYYQDIYQAIMQACEELESLAPYKAELKSALEADPRFSASQTD